MPSTSTDSSGAQRAPDTCPGVSLTVLYDGACPLCTREVAWYQRREPDQGIAWVDLSRRNDASLPDGVTHAQALARFHVIDASGRAETGAAAFARLWECYPGLRAFARLARRPRAAGWLEWGYRKFLHLRQRIARLLPPLAPAPPLTTHTSRRQGPR